MVRSCQAEGGVQDHFDALLKARATGEVGVLVGKPGVGSKDLLLAVIKTPEQVRRAPPARMARDPPANPAARRSTPLAPARLQDGQPVITLADSAAGASTSKAKKSAGSSSKGGAAVALEAEWLAEHCHQARPQQTAAPPPAILVWGDRLQIGPGGHGPRTGCQLPCAARCCRWRACCRAASQCWACTCSRPRPLFLGWRGSCAPCWQRCRRTRR